MKSKVGRNVRRVRHLVLRATGGFLPDPLSRRAPLMTAGLAAFVLLAFADSTIGLVIGLVLTVLVWFPEFVQAVTASKQSVARHSTVSFEHTLLLTVGLGSIYAAKSDHLVWIVWLSMFSFGLAAWLIRSQPGFLATKPLTAANFEHLPVVGQHPRVQARGLLRVHWSIFAVCAVLVITGMQFVPWTLLTLTGLALVLVLWNVLVAWTWADKARWRTLRELRRLRPRVMMPYGGSASFHIPMWEEYVGQLNVPYFIETLKPRTVEKLAELTDAPIICPSGISSAEVNSVIPPSVQLAFYVHNAAENKGFLQNRNVTSVWVHHGDGDKLASYRSKSADYDYLFVAGQGAIDRYAANGVCIPADKFRIIGRPQTEAIAGEDRSIADIEPQTVLYAPTWHGKKEIENYSSLEFGVEIVQGLIARDSNVIFRPHPASKSSAKYRGYIKAIQAVLEEDSKKSQRMHTWGEQAETTWSVADAANASNAMVSDVSGIVTDYMQSKKPYAMVTLMHSEEEFQRDFPTSRASYVITKTSESLDSALDKMLGSDPLRESRQRARTYYLGGFESHQSAERFVEESRALMNR